MVWAGKNFSFQARSQNCEERLLASSPLSVCPSVLMEQLGSNWTYFHEMWYLSIFSKSCWGNSSFHWNRTGSLRKEQYAFLIKYRSVLFLWMKYVSDKICRGNQNTSSMFNYFFSENRAVYEKIWKNIVERSRPHMTVWRMLIAYWTNKATNKHSECVTFTAFPLQQWLHERAPVLRTSPVLLLLRRLPIVARNAC